jgi:predicted Rossmann fold flavoprotein
MLAHKKVAILEQNSEVAKKIKVSGGGRCNITNATVSEKNYRANEAFIKPILEAYDNQHLLGYLDENDLETKKLNKIVKGQYFFNSSEEFIKHLRKINYKNKIFTGIHVKSVTYDKHFSIKTNKRVYEARKVIVATGGISYERLGVSDVGYEIAKSFGHEVSRLNPALVGFTVQPSEFWFKELSGVSSKVRVTIKDRVFEQNLLFTHKGCSGPAMLNASLYWEKGNIEIDFLPDYEIDALLKGSKKYLSTLLPLPKKMVQAFLKAQGLEDKAADRLSADEREKLNHLKSYTFAPAGTFGYSGAEITKGGVMVDELDNNLQSTHQKGLYFIGEVLDVSGELGGYNFQWAYSSACQVAKALS